MEAPYVWRGIYNVYVPFWVRLCVLDGFDTRVLFFILAGVRPSCGSHEFLPAVLILFQYLVAWA